GLIPSQLVKLSCTDWSEGAITISRYTTSAGTTNANSPQRFLLSPRTRRDRPVRAGPPRGTAGDGTPLSTGSTRRPSPAGRAVEVWVMCSPHKLSRSTAGGAPRAGSPDAASIRSALIDEALELGLDLRQGLLERGLPILEFDPTAGRTNRRH